MNLRQISVVAVFTFVWMSSGKASQTQTSQIRDNNVFPVELSVPFGSVPGNLVMSSDYLLFVDSAQPGGSFVIARSDLADFHRDGDRITIELTNPIKDRTGERRNLTFRTTEADRSRSLAVWMRAASEPRARGGAERSAPDQATIYQVIHNHVFGECTGRLIVSGDRLIFESVTDLDDSRQWSLQDIREVKRSNPYALEVQPFVGKTYNFELLGQGMDSDTFRRLVDRITTLRTPSN